APDLVVEGERLVGQAPMELDAETPGPRQPRRVMRICVSVRAISEVLSQGNMQALHVRWRDEQIDVANRAHARHLAAEKARRALEREHLDAERCTERRELRELNVSEHAAAYGRRGGFVERALKEDGRLSPEA